MISNIRPLATHFGRGTAENIIFLYPWNLHFVAFHTFVPSLNEKLLFTNPALEPGKL